MIIHKLRIKNINSLAGEWIIDFSDKAYASNRIFAITGDTASGKTSILDAICYALYGQTPRQSSVSKTVNEIMTRGESECEAEVTFETNRGIFRALRGQRRARNKADGKLQLPYCALADVAAGKDIVSGENVTKQYNEEIVRCIGLNYEQFTKAVLLAQGSFSAFLKDKPSKRAEILEKLTNSEIYQKMSAYTFEHLGDMQREHDGKQNRIDALHVLGSDERAALAEKAENAQSDILMLEGDIKTLEGLLAWRKKLIETETECNRLRAQQSQIDEDIRNFLPDKMRLDNAAKANTLRDKTHQYEKLCKDFDQFARDMTDLEAETECCAEKLQIVAGEKMRAEADLNEAKSRFDSIIDPKLRDMRRLFQAIAEAKNEFGRQDAICKEKNAHLEKCRKQFDIAKERVARYLGKKAECDRDLAKYPNGEALSESYSGICEKIRRLGELLEQGQNKRKSLDEYNKNLVRIESELAAADAQCKKLSDEAAIWENKKNALDASIENRLAGKSIDEIRGEIEDYRNRIEEFKQFDAFSAERSLLKDGARCPLCGSLDHPGISKETTDKTIRELQEKLENAEKIVADDAKDKNARIECKNALIEKQSELDRCQNRADGLKNMCDAEKLRIAEIENERKDLLAKYCDERDKIREELTRIGEEDAARAMQSPKSCLEALGNRYNHYKSIKESCAGLEAEKTEADTAFARDQSLFEAAQKAFDEAAAILSDRRQKLAGFETEMRDKYGDADPETEEKREKAQIECLNYSFEKKRNEEIDLNTSRERLKTKCENLCRMREKTIEERDICQTELLSSQTKLGFASLEDLKAAMMPDSDVEALQSRDRTLREAKIKIAAQRENKDRDYALLRAQNCSEMMLPDIERSLDEKKRLRDDKNKTLGGIREKLAGDGAQAKLRDDLMADLEKHKLLLDHWKELNELIGSKTGSKFRNFAQSLTFEHLLRNANGYLEQFNDRYVLVNRTMAECMRLDISKFKEMAGEDPDEESPAAGGGETAQTSETQAKKQSKKKTKISDDAKNSPDDALSFLIIDKYQDCAMRPISNLSGGETFIVSLALALGLADMASNNTQIDTLFLDEGFGTLDNETLHAVIATLNRLVGDCAQKRLGIISHVEDLKQAIETQIAVTPLGGGRSRLDGPGISGGGA